MFILKNQLPTVNKFHERLYDVTSHCPRESLTYTYSSGGEKRPYAVFRFGGKQLHRVASMLDSDCEPWSEELELDIVSDDLIFGLYSVITTVTLFTVTSRVCALLLSTFFSLGGCLLFLSDRLSFFSRFGLLVAGRNCVATCWATSCGLIRGFLVEVPLRTSHIRHLNASAVFLYVHTLQSQKLSSNTFA